MSKKQKTIHFNVLSNYKPNTLIINSAFVPIKLQLIDSYVLDSTNSICAICLSKIKVPFKFKPCCHIYCKKCISKWLKYNSTCPICRGNILS